MIGEYGVGIDGVDFFNELLNLMEYGVVVVLVDKISQIVVKLVDVDFCKIVEKFIWFEKMFGCEVECQVRYQVVCKMFDQLLDEVEGVVQCVWDMLCVLDDMFNMYEVEVDWFRVYI